MSTWGSSASMPLPLLLLKRFNAWRARRMYRRIVAMAQEAERMKRKADHLMGDNIKPPLPDLFDGWLDGSGR